MSMSKIVIAGAGLAGLTLGRCLLSKGIRAVIIEKTSPSSRRHDYSIDLYNWAYRPLLDVLGTSESTFIENLSVSPRVLEACTSIPRALRSDDGTSQKRFRCHRGRLEALLSQGLDINWDHNVLGASQGPEYITIDIESKPHIQTAMLVATDGIHSSVRKSLVRDSNPKVHSCVVFYGTRSISRETYTKVIAPQMQNENCIEIQHDGALLRIFINNTASKNIDIGYTYSRPAHPNTAADPLYKPNRPAAGAKDIPEAFYTELRCLTNLGPACNEVFDPMKVRRDRVLHWLMRSVLPSCSQIRGLAGAGIVMIGDAAHAMPILGSEGANMAIKDAVDLAEWIATKCTTDMGKFVESKYGEWKDGVEQGVKSLENMHEANRAVL